MSLAVLTDFDDTAAFQNVAELLLNKFGDPSWMDIRGRFRSGELTLKEYQEITFRNILADRSQMSDYVKQHASFRPYFGEVWQHCNKYNYPMAIVSQGLDFYIEALLEKYGFDQIPVYAVNTEFSPEGLRYEYTFTYPDDPERGNSKGLIVNRFQDKGYKVIYIGDGRSDFEAAVEADEVFAHSVLAKECQQQGIPFRPFSDFGAVIELLRTYSREGS